MMGGLSVIISPVAGGDKFLRRLGRPRARARAVLRPVFAPSLWPGSAVAPRAAGHRRTRRISPRLGNLFLPPAGAPRPAALVRRRPGRRLGRQLHKAHLLPDFRQTGAAAAAREAAAAELRDFNRRRAAGTAAAGSGVSTVAGDAVSAGRHDSAHRRREPGFRPGAASRRQPSLPPAEALAVSGVMGRRRIR